jgi:hypothetical protein
MPIDWSKNENNVKLLASTYAALGKEAVSPRKRIPYRNFDLLFSQFSNRFVEIARYFGHGATYDAIHKRFKVIAEQSHTRMCHNSRATIRRGPRSIRRRSRRDGTAKLGPDDLEVVEQGRFRTPVLPLRNGSSRCPGITGVSVSPRPSSSPEDGDIEHGDYMLEEYEESPPSVESPVPTVNFPSSVEPVSYSFEADMAANVNETLDGRLARSSQEHAKQRAQSRLMYMEAPPNKPTNETLPSWQQPVPANSSASGAGIEVGNTFPSSYIDPSKNLCLLCKLRFSGNLRDALQHEIESELHRSNLRRPELVQLANEKLLKMRMAPPSDSRSCHYVPGRTTEVDNSQSLPVLERSTPELVVSDMPPPSIGTRDSPIMIVDAHPDKGKRRAAPSATPIAVRRLNYADEMRRLSARGKKNLPSCVEAFEVLDDVAMALDDGTSHEPSSSDCIISVYDDPQDEDYIR